MNENRPNPAVEETAQTAIQPLYEHPYYTQDGKLYIEKQSRSGPYLEQLCNFTPRIVSEVTFDDGQTVRKEYRIGGEDEYGNPLPEMDVAADELGRMDWLANHWPATLRLSVVSSVEKHVQCAMKETAVYAEQKYVFAHTGWKEIDGQYHFLLPGCGEHEVRLCGKQKAYCSADTYDDTDLVYLAGFLQVDFIPHPVMFPCLALVFLSPLNEFLHRGGCEPKFILSLIGRTGSMKSTVAALILSFFGHFTATKLPMSFHDTANILLAHAAKQSDAVITDKPTHVFIRKLFAMIECGQASLVKKDVASAVSPSSLLGYEDDEYCYIFFEASHKAVSKFCADQNEVFTITTKALAKQLAEEGLIEVTDSGKNTRSLPFGGVNKRVMLVKKNAVKNILDGI